MYSKHKNGLLSELMAEQYLVKHDNIVARTITDFQEYDLIGIIHGNTWRYQVKTIYWDRSKNRHLCSLVTSHIRGNGKRYNKKYTLNSFDYLLAICYPFKVIYEIPIEKIVNRRSITFYFNIKDDKKIPKNNFEGYRVYL
jgi:hypothetical protein